MSLWRIAGPTLLAAAAVLAASRPLANDKPSLPSAKGVKELKSDTLLKNSIGLTMRLISAGDFVMGSPESEDGRDNDERQHRVRITRSFYLGEFEVTQAEYRSVMGVNPSWFSANGGGRLNVRGVSTDRFPVETVSWFEALEFCNRLSVLEKLPPYYSLKNIVRNSDGSVEKADVTPLGGDGYRLPTEAEWEYACRAGSNTPYQFGPECDSERANVDGRELGKDGAKSAYLRRTAAAGSYEANAFGLYDMHGNVWEWCSDWYDTDYYKSSPANDPTGSETGTLRIRRGGSWDRGPKGARSAYRRQSLPSHRYIFIGFRLARSLTSP